MKHVKVITKAPTLANDDNLDLPFIIATIQFVLTILQALQSKKAATTTT
ncbi:MAG: hypothetical protein KJ052_04390 [Candidatus Hydrogenedentes bacterium]|nr:hypothetical protein [Candidatus Hydrogenedentota bacterium]